MATQPTAAETALLTIQLVHSYDQEKEKNTTRARISAKTLRRVSMRSHLREAFVNDWIDALGRYGWAAFPTGDNFALIQSRAIDGWPRVGSKRIMETLRRIQDGDLSVFDEIAQHLDADEAVDDD